MTSSPLRDPKTRAALQAATLSLLTILAAGIFWGFGGGHKDFYNELWGPAYLLVHGQNAYDTSSLGADLPALWLPPAVGVFSPLGWLPEETAARVWLLLSLSGLALTVFLSLGRQTSILVVLLTGLMVFFFPPTMNHLALGQFSILAALGCLLAVLCAARERPWPEAFLLALSLAKPQLALFVAAGLGFHHLRQEGLPGAARFGLRVGAAFIVLSLPVILVSRGWLQSLGAGLAENPDWPHPSLFTFLQAQVAGWAWPLWGILLAAGLYICWRLWNELPPQEAAAWTLGLTPLLSPYIGSWDFILLLPAWVMIFSRVEWKRRAFLLLAYLAGWAGMAAIQLSADFSNLRFWWVPPWFLGTLLVAQYSNRGNDWANLKQKEAGRT